MRNLEIDGGDGVIGNMRLVGLSSLTSLAQHSEVRPEWYSIYDSNDTLAGRVLVSLGILGEKDRHNSRDTRISKNLEPLAAANEVVVGKHLGAVVNMRVRLSAQGRRSLNATGTHFICFTSSEVQIMTLKARQANGRLVRKALEA